MTIPLTPTDRSRLQRQAVVTIAERTGQARHDRGTLSDTQLATLTAWALRVRARLHQEEADRATR